MVLDVIVDFARGVALPESTAGLVESHVEVCRTCAARLQRERELSAGLKAVAGLTSAARPAPEMEQRLLEALAAMHTKAARTRTYSRVWRAAAAVLLVMTGLATWTASTVTPDPSFADAARQRGAAAGGRGALDDFMLLPVASGLPALE